MRIFYKCLTAVLVALVTCFSASAFTVYVDNPDAFSKVMDDNGTMYQITQGNNEFDATNGASNLLFYLQSPWEMVSFTAPNGQNIPYNSIYKAYAINYNRNTTGTYTIETHNPEAQQEFSVTMDVDNIEALVVETSITWGNWESFQLTQNETKIPWGEYMMIRFKAADGWKIKTISANNTYEGDFVAEPADDGWYNYYSGQDYSFTITTEQEGAEEEFSVAMKVDNIEALVVETSITWGNWESFQLTQNETKIPWGEYMMIRFKAADGWKIKTISANNTYEGDFVAEPADDGWYNYYSGQNYTFDITTEQEGAEPTFATLTIDNPEAVTLTIEYDDGTTNDSPTFVNGELKIDTTTQGGLVYMSPNQSWTIQNAEGFQNYGMYILRFEAGDTNTYAITTAADTQSTFITLNLDNPGAVTVEVMDIELQTIQPQDGVYKINTATAGTIYVNPVSPWQVLSVDGLNGIGSMTKNEQNGSFYLDFAAGATGTYYITTTKPSTFTLTIDNPEAVKAELYYNFALSETFTFTEKTNTFPITTFGSVKVIPNESWKIESCTGTPNNPAFDETTGAYTVYVGTDQDQSLDITTSQVVVEPTYSTLIIDNPEAVMMAQVEYFSENEELNTEELALVQGENKFVTTNGGRLLILPNTEWTILTHEGLMESENPFFGGVMYGAEFEAGATAVYTITSEPKSAATYITVNVDHPEAITAKVVYSDESVDDNPTLTDGAYKIDTTKGGTLQVKAKSPWTIVSAEGFNHVLGYYNLDFTAGAEDTYSITTHNPESGEPTHITLTVDHPEAVTVTLTYTDKEAQTIEAVDGVYTIDTTTEGGRFDIAPVSPWEIVDAGSLLAHWKYVGQYYTTFDAGAENTYNVTTNYTDAPEKTYSTLIIDNPEAVMMAQVEYSDETPNLELELVAGENRFETTSGGTLVIAPNSEWTILTYEGLLPFESPLGLMYTAEFEAGTTPVYTITSVKTSEASKLILNIDNPEGVTVQLSYEGEDAQEIELQEGDNEILTIKGGDIMLTLKENWTLTSAPDFNQIPGTAKYLMHFDAGDTQTYTVSVNNEASVDSILGDEVIETAVFNMQGIKVADSTDNLAAGMYIIAGKKVVVK